MESENDHKSAYDSLAMQAALRLYMPRRECPEEPEDDGEELPPETRRLLLQACSPREPSKTHRRDKGKRT